MPNEKQAGGSDKSTDEKREDATVKKMPKASVDGDLVRVIEKIQGAESILVALSKDPTLDEIAAALGLTMALDNMGKHVTAIYSGKTPSVLEFLQPEKTFETNTNSLQDFIISLSKDKADHLRYKIEGDFVRVYITPYRTTIDKNDLEFSHGEVNVDLIISLNVTEMGDFDAALAKHGRIMHDASAINISNTVPGRLGGVEWNRASASSVSEMVVTMLKEMEQPMTEDIATALLTGIEAETERFSNEKTTPEAMTLAAKLMEAGANQQLIVANIMRPEKKEEPEKKEDEVEPGSVEVNDEENAAEEKSDVAEEKKDGVSEEGKDDSSEEGKDDTSEEKKDDVNEEDSPEKQLEKMIIGGKKEESNAMKELSVMGGEGETTTEQAVEIPKEEKMENKLMAAVPTVEVPVESVYGSGADRTNLNDKTVEPLNIEKPKDFGAMMEEALAEPATNPAIQAAPAVQTGVEGAVPTASSDGQDLSNMVNQMVANAQQQPVQMMQTVPEQTLEPVQPMQAAPEQTLEPVQPSQGIELPPPPAPMPINGMMPPEMPSLPPVQPQQVTPVAPTETVPQMSPVQPLMPAQQVSPVQPLMPAQQMSPVQPPAPVDESAAEGVSVAPDGTTMAQPEQPVNPVVVQPELNQNSEGNDNSSNSSQPVQDPTLVPPVQDPGAFKIPGM